MLDANAAAGPNTITFDPSVFSTPQTITLASVITVNGVNDTLTIIGPGANLLTVSGNNAVKVFSISAGETTSISGMTITQAITGAVDINGTLTFADSAFVANTDTSGGSLTNNGTLTVNGCSFINNTNTAPGVNGAGGAAIWNNGEATVNASTFSGNMTTGGAGGGAIDNRGVMTINGSTFTGNATTGDAQNSRGGVINNQGAPQLTINGSVFTANSSVRDGGAIYHQPNSGTPVLTITDSTFSNNRSNSDGNTTGNGGALRLDGTGTVVITGSTISGNRAISGSTATGSGGGIATEMPLTLTNSTVSGNRADLDGGGIYASGVSTAILNLEYVTIVENTALRDGGGLVRASATNPANVRSTLIGNNIDDGTAPDVLGTIVSQGYNLIETTTGSTINGTTTGNITGQDPLIDGVLRWNGAATMTHALLLSSPALDAGDPAAPAGVDQRGQPRPADGNRDGTPRADIGAYERQPAEGVHVTAFDFDGEGPADLSLFRPSDGTWYIDTSGPATPISRQFGQSGDKPAPADYDGDGKADLAVWRDEPSDPDRANYYILLGRTNTFETRQFGRTGDLPLMTGDWDGDELADLAVYRDGGPGGQSYFYYRPTSQPGVDFVTVPWGLGGDRPVHADFDGDARVDVAVFRPSTAIWYILQSSNGEIRYGYWGLATDQLVPADYDGDQRADLAVFRPSDGIWYIEQSSNGQPRYEIFGLPADTLVPADYDGDGRTDVAVFRDGIWYIKRSSDGAVASVTFGLPTDVPVPVTHLGP